MADVSTILNELKSEASFDSHGHFSLDKNKAREKMRQYQLIDPHYYVLEIIQAAVASGATYIDVYLDSDDCIIVFDGTPYTRTELDNIYSSLFVSQKDTSLERFRELAIGINSAQALNPKFIKVISGDGAGTATQLLIKPPNFEQLVDPEVSLTGTRIHVKDRVSWRVANRFFKNITSQLPTEGQVIKDRCLFCRIPIKLNNDVLQYQNPMSGQEVLCSKEFERDGIRGVLGIPSAPFELSHLQLVKWGVLITTRHLRLSFIPIVGMIEANGLTKNASQSDIVENEAYKQVLETVKSVIDDLIVELVDQYDGYNASSDYPKKLRSREIFLDIIESRFRVNSYTENAPLLIKKLANVDLFETTDRRFVNLSTLIEQFNKTGYLPFSRKYFNDPHPEDLDVLFLSDEKQVNYFDKIFSYRIKNVEQDFFQAYAREQNRNDWVSAKTEKVMLLSDPLVRHSFTDGSIFCEMGLVQREADGRSRVSFYKENSFLTEKHIEIDGLFFDAVINNDNLVPNYLYDDVKMEDEFKGVISSLLTHLPALYSDYARVFSEMPVYELNKYARVKTPEEKVYDICRLHLIRYMNFVLGPRKEDNAGARHAEADSGQSEAMRNIRVCHTLNRNKKPMDVNETFSVPYTKLVLTDELRNLKLFQTVSGSFVSLADLEKDMESHLLIRVVPKEMFGTQLYDGSIVVTTFGEDEVLKKYFGWYKVENYEQALLAERNAMRHMTAGVERPSLKEKTLEKISFNIGGVIGEVGLLPLLPIVSDSESFLEEMSIEDESSVPRLKIDGVTIRVMKQGREVTNRFIEMPFRDIIAVTDYNQISVTSDWKDIREDSSWNTLVDSVRKSLDLLAAKLLDRYASFESEDRVQVRHFLLQYASSHIGRLDYSKLDGVRKQVSDILVNLPLFPSYSGEEVTLNQIMDSRKRFSKVGYVLEVKDEIPADDRLILRVNYFELDCLKHLFGEKYMENMENSLLARRKVEEIIRSKPEELPVLEDNLVLCKVTLPDTGAVTGEVGLLRSENAPKESVASVRVLKMNRYLMTKLLPSGMQLAAVLNLDTLTTDSSFTSVVEDHYFDELKKALFSNLDNLMEILLQEYSGFTDQEQYDAELHIVSYLTSRYSRYKDIQRLSGDTLPSKLADVKAFPILGGRKLSLREITEYYEKENQLNYVLLGSDQVPLNEENYVLVLNQKLQRFLNRLFSNMYNYTDDLVLDQHARTNLEKPALPDLVIHDTHLVKVLIDEQGMKGELALPTHFPSQNRITFTKNNRPIVSKSLYEQSNVFGVLNYDDFSTNKIFSDVNLFSAQKRIILKGIYNLYLELVKSIPLLEGTPSFDTARRLLLEFYHEQKQYVSGEYRIMDSNLESMICTLSLIPIYDGRFVSINVVKSEAERLGYIPFVHPDETYDGATENIILCFDTFSFEFEFCRKMVGIDRLKHYYIIKQLLGSAEKSAKETGEKMTTPISPPLSLPSPDMDADPLPIGGSSRPSLRLKTVSPSGSDVVPGVVKDTPVPSSHLPSFAGESASSVPLETGVEKPRIKLKDLPKAEVVPEEKEVVKRSVVRSSGKIVPAAGIPGVKEIPIETPESLSPEMKFLFAIKKEFRIIRERGDYKLSENILKTAQLISSDTLPAVVFKDNQLFINSADPTTKQVMKLFESEPHAVYYLLSLIYSTINKELLEITDDDEMKFQMVMLENLLHLPSLSSRRS